MRTLTPQRGGKERLDVELGKGGGKNFSSREKASVAACARKENSLRATGGRYPLTSGGLQSNRRGGCFGWGKRKGRTI